MLARLFFGALENGARLLGLVGAARRCLVCREAISWGLPPFFLLPKDVAPISRTKVAPKSHQSWISREKSNFDAVMVRLVSEWSGRFYAMFCLGRAFGVVEGFNRHGPRAEDVIDRRIDARVRIAGGGAKSIDKSMAHLLPMLHGWRKLKG